MPFIYMSCLFALAGTSSTTLTKIGESGHPCLIPYLRRRAFKIFVTEYNVKCGFVIYMDFILLQYVPSILNFLRVLIMKEYCIYILFLSFILLIIFIDLCLLKHPYIPLARTAYYHFNVLLNSICYCFIANYCTDASVANYCTDAKIFSSVFTGILVYSFHFFLKTQLRFKQLLYPGS